MNAQAADGAMIRTADWPGVARDLDAYGHAVLPGLLEPGECADTAALFDDARRFRSHVVMARHGFGSGEYKYFADPLPPLVEGLRTALYARLAPLANDWADALGLQTRYPSELAGFRARCREKGQTRPTPLLLRYGAGDYNRLHQDLYGELAFPLQVAVLLSAPGRDFTGGEFVLTEQRPRMQTRAEVVDLRQGDAVVFAVRHRPVRSARGHARVALRHGVSRVRSGSRYCLGIIFHDAA